MQPYELTATETVELISRGQLSCEELARSCLQRIDTQDVALKAWVFVDPMQVLRNARELDKTPTKGLLHGTTWGVKDVIDTFDMPTQQNSPIYKGHVPRRDAACVAVARHHGSLFLGKTETHEFAAAGRRPLTRNSRSPIHSPGGSSSGSAAAVGARMAQLAFGTQTGGSLIRPAAYNGIYGFKPTHGVVSNEGAKIYAPSLDTIGWYGRSMDDLILVSKAFRLMGATVLPKVEVAGLRVGLCKGPGWSHITSGGEAALHMAASCLEAAGANVEELELTAPLDQVTHLHRLIMRSEGSTSFLPEFLHSHFLLHDDLRRLAQEGDHIAPEVRRDAYDMAAQCRQQFDRYLAVAFDVVLTPSAPGEAPLWSDSDGTMIFNAMWTALHVPCIAIPVGIGEAGLPLGVQLVGSRASDARLLAIALACSEIIDQGAHSLINTCR